MHPEHRDVVVFDDEVFEIGDMVEVEIILDGDGLLIFGRIYEINESRLSIDCSEKYHSNSKYARYESIRKMKHISQG